jgi:hypothetical protein
MAFNFLALILIPLYIAIPAIILYFVIKLAVKNALRELKEEDL